MSMSKTTTTLFVILLIFIGVLLFILFGMKQNPIIKSLTRPLTTKATYPETILSLSTSTQTARPGQTVTTAVLIHNTDPEPDLVQLEIAYDPLALTIDSVTPGTFFRNPAVALQNIDPVAGRISYALHCPVVDSTKTSCVNKASQTVTTITFTLNSYTIKDATALSFLPKTVVRTQGGRDILQKTNSLQLAISRTLYPISSSSAIASPAGNNRILPYH